MGHATDPQPRDCGLVALEARTPFLPPCDAAPLVGRGALDRAPAIRDALGRLVGRLDPETMRGLIEAVESRGFSPAEVAAEALSDLDLIEGGALEPRPSLRIAAGMGALGGSEANRALRAVRRALPRRGVACVETPRAANAIRTRAARLALAPVIDAFRLREGVAETDPEFEAVAAVGSTLVHALRAADAAGGLASTERIVTGP
ncbi:MAG TPA: glycine betaine ABC transporter substrate-binding protein [Paracoccaceae bacterium]|nr:glycine betaine ABC transporter substrate-binding protein [Paracoccaceae bacterium]